MGDWNCLLFQDLPRDRTMRWSEAEGLSVWRSPSNYANGQARDRQGDWLPARIAAAVSPAPAMTEGSRPCADRHDGRRLNAPNDIAVKSDGSIWFTDPLYGLLNDYEGGRQQSEQRPAVYRLDPHSLGTGRGRRRFRRPEWPRLLAGRDEALHRRDRRPEPAAPEAIHKGVRRRRRRAHAFGRATSSTRSSPATPTASRWTRTATSGAAPPTGVHCISPQGKLLGKILVPYTVSNLAFGDRHASRLFIGGSHTLYSIFLNRRAAARSMP